MADSNVTLCMRLRMSDWLVRGPGFHPGLCLRSYAEAVEPEGGWSEQRASPALFPTAAAAFFGPSLSSASPRDHSQRAGALAGPGLCSGQWGQTRPREGGAGRDPLGDPCCSLSGSMWPPPHFYALRQGHLSQDMPSSLSTTTLGRDMGDKVDKDSDLSWAPGRWARVEERD